MTVMQLTNTIANLLVEAELQIIVRGLEFEELHNIANTMLHM